MSEPTFDDSSTESEPSDDSSADSENEVLQTQNSPTRATAQATTPTTTPVTTAVCTREKTNTKNERKHYVGSWLETSVVIKTISIIM